VGDGCRRVAQALPEEEEESTGSEDEGNVHEHKQDITRKNGTHLQGPFRLRGVLIRRIAAKSNYVARRETFEDLRHRVMMESAPSPILPNGIAKVLCDHSKIRVARARLKAEVDNKELDLVTRRRIQGICGLLNLYIDGDLNQSWRKTSVAISKAQGFGNTHARRIREWTLKFLQTGNLPLHRLGHARWTVLRDEDIASEIKLKMVEKSKKGFLRAEDLVDLIASPEMQKTFSEKGICKASISKKTATRWLEKLDWRYEGVRNGMYIDGHEREDVVEYRREFVERWKTREKRFHQFDNDGHELPRPNGFSVPDGPPFRLVLVTHDESTFYQNDRRKTVWAEKTSRPMPQPKGEGQTLMVSDFLTSEWGRLRDGDESVHSPIPFFFLLTCLQRCTGHLQSRKESRWIFWRDRISRASRLHHRHFRRPFKR
jgi:hypothetical protein